MIYKSLYGNNFFGYVLDLLGFGVAVAGCFLKDKHWITSSLSRSCQVRCQIDEDAEPTMRKTCQYLSHVEHWYGIPCADRREVADRQIFQPVVTVTQSELWNQGVTVINHISDLSRTNRVDATGEFTSP
mgnify:CR=1 FL=1